MHAQMCSNCGLLLQPGVSVCPRCGAPQAAPARRGDAEERRATTRKGSRGQFASLYALGDAFVGTPASLGARLLSLLIDLAVIALVAVVAWFLSESLLLTVLAGLEVAIIMAVAQAHTGASLGKLVTRTRVSQSEEPMTPGIVRATVRSAISGLGALVAAVGAFAIELTAVADSTGRRRTIADRAARTVVVSIPTRRERAAADEEADELSHRAFVVSLTATSAHRFEISAGSTGQPSAQIPGAPPQQSLLPAHAPLPTSESAVPIEAALGAPQVHRQQPATQIGPPPTQLPSGMPPGVNIPQSAGLPSHTQAPAPEPVAPAVRREPVPVTPQPVTSYSRTPLARQARSAGTLLTFDTGQHETISPMGSATLGRAPEPASESDVVVVVSDQSKTISKNHARWEEDQAGVWVTDLGSTNGTELVYEDGRVKALISGIRTSATGVAYVRIGDRTFTMSAMIGGAQ